MENQRTLLTFALLAISAYLYIQWLDFSNPVMQAGEQAAIVETTPSNVPEASQVLASIVSSGDQGIPIAPVDVEAAIPSAVEIVPITDPSKLVTVDTDIVRAVINITGGVIERLELKQEPVSIDKPDQGFALLKNDQNEVFTAEDGLFAGGGLASANHQTNYSVDKNTYTLGAADKVSIPLRWTKV